MSVHDERNKSGLVEPTEIPVDILKERALGFEVLLGLVTPDDLEVGPDILHTIAQENIKRIVFIGEPASGKSTARGQLMKALQVIKGPSLQFTHAFFDDAFAEKLQSDKEQGMEKDVKEWDTTEWADVSQRLDEKINIEEEIPEDTIQVVELIGIGVKNRGKSSLRKIGDHMRERRSAGLPDDTVVVGVIPHGDSQNKTIQVRAAIPDRAITSFDQLSEQLQRSYQIYLEGLEDVDGDEKLRRLREYIAKTASPGAIQRIVSEVNQYAEQIKRVLKGHVLIEEDGTETTHWDIVDDAVTEHPPRTLTEFNDIRKYEKSLVCMQQLLLETGLADRSATFDHVYNVFNPKQEKVVWNLDLLTQSGFH